MTAPHETFHGFVETTTDTLLIFEACRRGILPKINRRLQEKERGAVKPGTVYVFDERESGIKRWTDGYVWSPSRILGNFLIYRELEGRDGNRTMTAATTECPTTGDLSEEDLDLKDQDQIMTIDQSRERALVGSLTTSYNFKKGGLIKKTMSIVINGSPQHLISYYTTEDVLSHRLRTPSSIPELACLDISADLLHRQSFRIPPTRPVAAHPHQHFHQELQQQHHYETSSMTVNRMSPYPSMPFPSELQRKRTATALLPDYRQSGLITKQEGTSCLDFTTCSYSGVNSMASLQATSSPPQEEYHPHSYYRYGKHAVVQPSPTRFSMIHAPPIYRDNISQYYSTYCQPSYNNAPPISPPPQHRMACPMYPIGTTAICGPPLSSSAISQEEKAAIEAAAAAAAAYYSTTSSSSSASPTPPIVYPMAQKSFIPEEHFYASPAVTAETTTSGTTGIQYY